MGGALAAVAHAFDTRFTSVSIASDYDIPTQRPHGSHPLVDSNYSSTNLRIRHEGITLSRFQKTELIADWGISLNNLRVCNRYKHYKSGALNCGKCEKCVRTMLALVARDVLHRTTAFPEVDVSEELVRSVVKLNPKTFPLYAELIGPLRDRGRHDLVHAIEGRLRNHYRSERIKKLKTLEQRYFRSNLAKVKGIFAR
jgi:hypothetical protein